MLKKIQDFISSIFKPAKQGIISVDLAVETDNLSQINVKKDILKEMESLIDNRNKLLDRSVVKKVESLSDDTNKLLDKDVVKKVESLSDDTNKLLDKNVVEKVEYLSEDTNKLLDKDVVEKVESLSEDTNKLLDQSLVEIPAQESGPITNIILAVFDTPDPYDSDDEDLSWLDWPIKTDEATKTAYLLQRDKDREAEKEEELLKTKKKPWWKW